MRGGEDPSTRRPPLSVPDGFELLEELGRGGSAAVWRARYALTGEDVALKVWFRPLLDDHERQRFRNECRWHRELSGHPRIVDWVWASSPHDGTPWIATRLHGISLSEYLLEEGRPPLETAVQLGLDLLDGLAAMHSRGLIHRDIKPSNLLVLDGRGALCDLGIAMPDDEVTREWRAGTPGYLPPELADDDADGMQPPDRRSDVWAAAATISRMIGDDAPSPIDHLVYAAAGSTNRLDRPADGQEFASRLRSAARQAGLQVPGEVDQHEPTRALRRRRALLAGVAASLAIVALTAAATARLVTGIRTASASQAAATAALQVLPDVGPNDRPLVRDHRNAGRCEGKPLPGGTQQLRVGNHVLAITRVFYDDRGVACAKLEKAPASGLYNQKTYLALSLCNAEGQCDYDWNRYRIDAGPVKISAVHGCVAWRASAMNAPETEWLLRDRTGSAGCVSGTSPSTAAARSSPGG